MGVVVVGGDEEGLLEVGVIVVDGARTSRSATGAGPRHLQRCRGRGRPSPLTLEWRLSATLASLEFVLIDFSLQDV